MSYSLDLIPDATGRRHARFTNPAALRIACLVPSITETLFALGLGDHVVARTGFCIHPEPSVRDVPKVGGTKDVNIRRLIATEPTHVIVNIDENRKADVDHLRKVIPNIIVTHPMLPDDNIGLFHLLGHIFSADEAAHRLATELTVALSRARTVGAQLPWQTVLYAIWKNPWMTISRDTAARARSRDRSSLRHRNCLATQIDPAARCRAAMAVGCPHQAVGRLRYRRRDCQSV